MRNDIRNSGIDTIGNVPWGTHFCQFYQTKEDLMDTFVPYLKAGLENNELCIWIIPEFLSVEEAKKFLRKTISDIDIYLKKGQIEITSSDNWHIKDGVFDLHRPLASLLCKVNQSLSSGYDGLRLTEDIFWLGRKNRNDLIDYERRMDSATDKYPIISLCTYSLEMCSATDIMDIVANHQFFLVRKEGKWEQIGNSGRKSTAECKLTEQELQESEERYRMLFTNMTDGFGLLEIIYNTDGKPCDYRYLEVNPAFELSLGVKREQILGRTMLDVFPNVSPIAIAKYEDVALSGKSIHFEIFSQITHKYLDIYAFNPEKGKLALILRDITERKLIEKELQESERKYRNIIETASEGIWIGDSESRTTYVNKRIAEVSGYTQDEMIGRYPWDFTDEGSKPVIKKNIEKRRQGVDESYEFKFLRKDGSPIWAIVNSKSLFDSNGKFIGSMSMLTDITRRKEVEAKLKDTLDNLENSVKERTAELEKAYNSLKESEKSLAEAQKMAHIGSWEWDIRADKAYWSDELYRIFGRDPQELAPPYNEYLSYIHPDDQAYFDNATKKAVNGKPYSIDYRIIRVDGEERTIHMQSYVIFDEENIPIRVKGTIQDITERKQMEEALRQNKVLLSAFLEQLPVGLGLADTNGHWLITNSVLRRFMGKFIPSLDPENSWRWRTWGIDGRLLNQSEWPSVRALRGENITPGLNFLYTSDTGLEIWTRVSSVPFRNEAGEIAGIITVIQDIDEQKKAEETLAKIDKIRIKEIHHRIKNNLQVISSLLDLQAEEFSHIEICRTPEVVEAFMESQSRVISMALIHEELYKGDKIDTLDFAAYVKKLLPQDALRVVALPEEAPIQRIHPVLPAELREDGDTREDEVRQRPRGHHVLHRLVTMDVEVHRHAEKQQRHERQEQPSREGVLHAAAHDQPDVEEPVPKNRVGERHGDRQEEREQPAHGGREKEAGRIAEPPADEHGGPGDASKAAAGEQDTKAPLLRRVLQVPIAPDSRHHGGHHVEHRHAHQDREAIPGGKRGRRTVNGQRAVADERDGAEDGQPQRGEVGRPVDAAHGKEQEEREEQRAEDERTDERHPEDQAGRPPHSAPDRGEPVRHRDAEDAHGAEEPGADAGHRVVRPAVQHEDADAQRHELDDADEGQVDPFARQPARRALRREDQRQLHRHPVPAYVDPDWLADRRVHRQRFPVELCLPRRLAIADRLPVDARNLVARPETRSPRRAPRGHRFRHQARPEVERYPFRLRPPRVAVDEQREVGEKRHDAGEGPPRGPSAGHRCRDGKDSSPRGLARVL